MTPELACAVMLNNYFHDAATAYLAACAVAMFALKRRGAPHEQRVIFDYLSVSAVISLVMIVLLGIPRMIYFQEMEYHPAAGKGLIVMLVVKHVILIALVITGIVLWGKLRKQYPK